MNWTTFFSFLAGITTILLAALVIKFGDIRKTLHRVLILLNVSLSIWGFGCMGAALSSDSSTALLWWKIAQLGGYFAGVFSLHIAFLVSNTKRRWDLIVSYTIAILFQFFSFLNILKIDTKLLFETYYLTSDDIKFKIFFILWILIGVDTTIVFIRGLMRAREQERTRIKYLLIAIMIGYWGGATHFLPVFGARVFPFANFLVAIYPLITTYAIMRHRLLDIEVIIKKTLVFTSLFAIVFGIFVAVTLMIQQLTGAGNSLLGFAISSVIIIFTVRPVEIFLVRITDRYLFQKKYDYRRLIKEFMDELKTMVLNTSDIAQSTVDFFNASIRPACVAIFIYNKFTNKYELIASSDLKEKYLKLAGDSPLIKILSEAGQAVRISNDRLNSSQEQKQFAVSGIELIVPLLVHKELIGVFCLGKKKSDENYTDEDMETLSGLSGALAISLNNAQLFGERADAEKRALVGTIATGINHEIGNPLNIITIKLEAFRILAKKGMLGNKSKEEIIENVKEITKVCLESTQRIAEITKQVAEFAKPDKKLALDKVNINEAIDETIVFLKNGMILDSGKIEKRVSRDPVYVMADRGQLKQILFNLIKNASHVIDNETGKIIVDVDKNRNDEVIIKIIDNGRGMPKEVLDKVFTPFFTTKDPGKGTGLGLALVKIMADRNNCRINVESQKGDGTTFTLIFKSGA